MGNFGMLYNVSQASFVLTNKKEIIAKIQVDFET
jgi:hypothetical protein